MWFSFRRALAVLTGSKIYSILNYGKKMKLVPPFLDMVAASRTASVLDTASDPSTDGIRWVWGESVGAHCRCKLRCDSVPCLRYCCRYKPMRGQAFAPVGDTSYDVDTLPPRNEPPEETLELDFVFGYRGKEDRPNVLHVCRRGCTEVVYHVGRIGALGCPGLVARG